MKMSRYLCRACGNKRKSHPWTGKVRGRCRVRRRGLDGRVVRCPCPGFKEEEAAV